MALVINLIDRHGPSNELRCQLQLKRTKVRLFSCLTKCVSFKSGCVVRVVKHLKGDWFIVLHQ